MNLQVQILRNAHIYTGCPTHLWAMAIALVGERVAALDDEALAWWWARCDRCAKASRDKF